MPLISASELSPPKKPSRPPIRLGTLQSTWTLICAPGNPPPDTETNVIAHAGILGGLLRCFVCRACRTLLVNAANPRAIIRGVVGVDTGKSGHGQIHERDRNQHDHRHGDRSLGKLIAAA